MSFLRQNQVYLVLVTAAILLSWGIWYGYGRWAGLAVTAGWVFGWSVERHRVYRRNGIGPSRTSLAEKARLWLRG